MDFWNWFRVLLVLVFVPVAPALAGQTENRIWFTWEQRKPDADLCGRKGYCKPVSRYITRMVESPNTQRARSMVGAMDALAKSRGHSAEHPDAPLICQNVNAMTVLGFDPESWELSEKLAALRDLPGVYFSVNGLKAPAGYEGPFGDQLQVLMEKKFRNAGIRVLSKDQMEKTPGQPQLNIYFSNTNADTGCWFSVFASLSQTMLLTRNHTIKVKAGSWGMSGGYAADFPDRSEFDAIMLVVDRFIGDYWKANSTKTKVSAKK